MARTLLTVMYTLTVFSWKTIANNNNVLGFEESKCGSISSLDQCLKKLPLLLKGSERNHALPISEQDIDSLCRAYRIGIECVDDWSKECLSAESRLISEHQTAGARKMMSFLCNDTAFRKEYLTHSVCFKAVSPDWTRCFAEFQHSIQTISDNGKGQPLSQLHMDLCCARSCFQSCIMVAGRSKCDRESAIMLRRMSETLSIDNVSSAKCKTLDVAVCSASTNDPYSLTFKILIICQVYMTTVIVYRLYTNVIGELDDSI